MFGFMRGQKMEKKEGGHPDAPGVVLQRRVVVPKPLIGGGDLSAALGHVLRVLQDPSVDALQYDQGRGLGFGPKDHKLGGQSTPPPSP